jgi:hypothetical protein
MREGLKGFWAVSAGIVPGDTMPQYTKNFYYLSAHYDEDIKGAKEGSKESHFQSFRDEALAYAKDIMDPRSVNWVKLEWVWV